MEKFSEKNFHFLCSFSRDSLVQCVYFIPTVPTQLLDNCRYSMICWFGFFLRTLFLEVFNKLDFSIFIDLEFLLLMFPSVLLLSFTSLCEHPFKIFKL